MKERRTDRNAIRHQIKSILSLKNILVVHKSLGLFSQKNEGEKLTHSILPLQSTWSTLDC